MQHGPETPSQNNAAAEESSSEIVQNGPSVAQETESGESVSFFESLAGGDGSSLAPGMLFLAAILLVLIVVMRAVSKSSARRKQTTRTMGDPEARIAKINHAAQSTMEPARRAMVEAEEITRRLGAVLDNKATKIEILLEEANLRIKELEAASHRPTTPEPRVSENRTITPETLDQARLDQDHAERNPPQVSDEALKFEAPEKTSEKTSEKVSQEQQPIQDQVTALAQSGLESAAIAERLNRPIGEIELILNLWRNSG